MPASKMPKIRIVCLKENLNLNGTKDIQTKVTITMFSLFAEIERDLISERTKEGLARARAEERRAMAVALEQENQAKVKEADAEVPLAVAEAFKRGNIGVMDFERIKNIKADTKMRGYIGSKNP